MIYDLENLTEDLISSADIVDVIGQYVSLKRRGANYIGLCPFHREKTPSFIVSSEKQIFKCFGCSEGGNVISFISKIEKLDYIDAIELLAEKVNFNLTRYEKKGGYNKNELQVKDKKARIFDLNKASAEYFFNALIEEVKNTHGALKIYLDKRNLDKYAITKFGIGYGTNPEEKLYTYLFKKGFAKEEMLEAGVITINKGGQVYENFGNRLIFPIMDIRDRVIGFGGRVLDNSLPKYVNSKENLVYSKGKNLYALNIAKKEKLNYILVTEGYMDTLALHVAGFSFAIASLGTALTENQAKLLKKYTPTVILGYDNDSAGKQATSRAIDVLVKEGLKVKVLVIDKQDVKDPDEYINKYGKNNFDLCIKKSISHIDYKVDMLKKGIDNNDINSKVNFLERSVKDYFIY